MTAFVKLALILAAVAGLAAPAAGQDYPSRNVKIIVPFGAGGPADVYARFVGQYLGEALKRPFVIENRPGAGAARPAAAARMSASFTNVVNCRPSEVRGMLEQSAVLSSRQALRPKENG